MTLSNFTPPLQRSEVNTTVTNTHYHIMLMCINKKAFITIKPVNMWKGTKIPWRGIRFDYGNVELINYIYMYLYNVSHLGIFFNVAIFRFRLIGGEVLQNVTIKIMDTPKHISLLERPDCLHLVSFFE